MSWKNTLANSIGKPNPNDIALAIQRLRRRIAEVEALEPEKLELYSLKVVALQASIDESLSVIFGTMTDKYNRYRHHIDFGAGIPSFGQTRTLNGYREDVTKGRETVLTMLGEAVRSLEERLTEMGGLPPGLLPASPPPAPTVLNRKVFIVHGHDELPREAVARFLRDIGFEPIILNEHANQNRTIIEKIEAHSDVGFAVVLLTPDDEGNMKGMPSQPRARQNVLLELGYFMAKLTRARVCAIKRGTVEIPSDFAGVIWTDFDNAGAWKTALAKELRVHFEVDWNLVMK